ncbi:carbohydrate-binding protein [Kosakonia radicincitans]|uniref:carbohydrate-binding protein n=1 Tax=Kosakonia radicincitans TaxID=283686 RepID=UPI0022B416A7|nr:carbohydrate-binding protein [Kosakonia radicincitans]
MKMTSLALMICASLSSSVVCAENQPQKNTAWEGNAYPAIVVKMKAASSLTRQQLPALLNLDDESLNVSAQFQHKAARGAELSELQALDAKYGFDRYLRIAIPQDKMRDVAYINGIVNALKVNPHVEVAYAEPEPVELDGNTATRSAAATVGDFRDRQYYKKAPNEFSPNHRLGGVNRDSVNQYAGHDGSNVTLVSNELGLWNQNHINLPKAAFIIGYGSTTGNTMEHDTSSVGVMAATDIGTGVKGLAYKVRMAHSASGNGTLYNAIPKLQAGDVVQVGIQIGGAEVTGCQYNCWLPLESYPHYFDVIKALTDKGVHVIEAAGNGNTNLDHSALGGKFNLNVRDSGAILVGAADPVHAARAGFSNYGSRVSSFSWGYDVTTTGYGDLAMAPNATYTSVYNGTSSANPIVAGVVASLSSIAKAHGKTVTPRQMREILRETGTALAGGAVNQIGTQPDMGRSVVKILELDGENNVEKAPTITLDHSTINTVGSSLAWSYQVVATSDQSGVSWEWKFVSGNSNIRLSSTISDRTIITVPGNLGNTQATFQVTATNSSGKSSRSNVTINVAKPSVTVTGATSMLAHQPVKLQAQANFEQASYNWRLLKSGQVVSNGIDQTGMMKTGLPAGDYVAEVTATSYVQGTRTATTAHHIKVTSETQNTDAAFINALQMALSSTDNDDSVTFNGNVTSAQAATSAPTYNWSLPAGAQGGSNGLASQRFTIAKTSQPQTLAVNVTVKAGTQSRVLTKTITVAAQASNDDGGYPQWAFGTAYKAGDVVTHKGKNFECVVAGWCSQAGEFSQLHYEPGVGLNWGMAWKLSN